jgi:predicted transcriptional regulator
MSTANKDSKKAKGNGDVAFFRKMTETLETTISTLAEQLKQRDEATTSLIAKLKQYRSW